MLKRVPLYVFPVYLAIAEYLLREIVLPASEKGEAVSFDVVGPSIVAAAMVLLFPVLVPREVDYRLDASVEEALRTRRLAIYSVADQRVTNAAWICLIFLCGVWVATLYMTIKMPNVTWNLIPVTLLIGGVAYVLGIFLTELKGI